MSVHESGEMYLEANLVLTRKTGFVRSIDVSEETAAADACKLEHAISDESFQALKRYASGILE